MVGVTSQNSSEPSNLGELYKTIVDTAQVIILILTKDGKIDYFNQYMQTMTGYSLEEVRGKDWFDTFLPAKDHERIRALFKTAIQGILTKGNSNAILTKDKRERLIEWYDKTLKDADGSIIGVLATGQDITESKAAEQKLQESEEKFRLLFETSRDAIMTLEPPTWKFTDCNRATIDMFKAKDKNEFISVGPWDVSPAKQPDGRDSLEKAPVMIGNAIRDGSAFFEWTHKRINGDDFPATVLLTKMERKGKIVVQATVRDITEMKKAEQTLRAKNEELERFNKLTVGRELKMVELKNKIAALEEQLHKKQ
ncbi:MAG: PAS domain-containing protein [archaeon]